MEMGKTVEIIVWDVWKVFGIIGLFLFGELINTIIIMNFSSVDIHENLVATLLISFFIFIMNGLILCKALDMFEHAQKVYKIQVKG